MADPTSDSTAMAIDEATRRRVIAAVAQAMFDHVEELTALDQAIGDGDHGLNMKRGFEAVMADIDTHAAKPLPEALSGIGMALVMKVGGASGPLYGTLLMTLGKQLPAEPTRTELVSAFGAAIEAVKTRGKSDFGQKTMLDVLGPVHAALRDGGDLDMTADEAADATVPLKAIRGRASFLGDRSIGHMDPGARSSALMIHAITNVLETPA